MVSRVGRSEIRCFHKQRGYIVTVYEFGRDEGAGSLVTVWCALLLTFKSGNSPECKSWVLYARQIV